MNDKFDFDNNVDCDPADCTTKKPAGDVDFDGFGEFPPEFPTDTNAEAAKEFEVPPDADLLSWHSDMRGFNNFDGAYGDEQDEDAEAATDYVNDIDGQSPDDYDCYKPDDETAATHDELYTTTCAEGRCALDDYEIISDVLGSEKNLVKLYSTALCEAAEEPLRNIIKENLTECAADQFKTFEFMESNGMYPTEQADEQKITQAKQQFTPLCRNWN